MTVQELIEELRGFNPEMTILIEGYEDGYDHFNIATEHVEIDNHHAMHTYSGQYQVVQYGTEVVVLNRKYD